MKSVDELLLGLYRSSMELPPGEHTQWLFGFLQAALSFDSAGRSSLYASGGEMLVMGSDIYHEDVAMLDNWQTVNRNDPVLARGLSHPGQATRFHSLTVMTSLRDAGMRDYLQYNAHHQNGLVILAHTSDDSRWDALGFYRANSQAQFSGEDLQLVQILTPHILQAIRINLQLAGAVAAPVDVITAIVGSDGCVRYATPGLAELLRLEWPGWRGYQLPSALMVALSVNDKHYFAGMFIEARARQSGNVMTLQLRARSPLSSLSDREMEAAKLFGAGLSTKEIARKMGVAPSTARNFIQRVYRKLEVNDKAALAVMLNESRQSR